MVMKFIYIILLSLGFLQGVVEACVQSGLNGQVILMGCSLNVHDRCTYSLLRDFNMEETIGRFYKAAVESGVLNVEPSAQDFIVSERFSESESMLLKYKLLQRVGWADLCACFITEYPELEDEVSLKCCALERLPESGVLMHVLGIDGCGEKLHSMCKNSNGSYSAITTDVIKNVLLQAPSLTDKPANFWTRMIDRIGTYAVEEVFGY